MSVAALSGAFFRTARLLLRMVAGRFSFFSMRRITLHVRASCPNGFRGVFPVFIGRHRTQKSPQPVQGLSGFHRMSWSLQVAERVGFRFNHPNSLNFIPTLALTCIKCIPKMDTFQATFSYVILLHRF